ncbi:MAG: DUF1289 domain-containing protein [Natronospirillum sp.]|uniref:DUF1289 domain-containing protein n=1 Tax=Natronospirillum sp. TaxID=2812955 RepID=UPI0025D90C1E|nr:DUF1289 domain-containing protein [Natronospirillum sp.]MCH8553000.1 DUF1289 domain-containing protein [Natronospirillum sp.]
MAKAIESPCVDVCKLSGDVCVGCGRTTVEIRQWQSMKRPEKMATVRNAALRLKKLKKSASDS